MAGETINLTTATAWCANFRDEFPNDTKAYFYSSEFFEDILGQEGCTGIRIYNAIDDRGSRCVILIGVDSNGKDMTTGSIVDRGDPCPPQCDVTSPLNSGD